MIASLSLWLAAWLVPSCLPPPVVGPVTRGFVAPACTYCPGHRGLEYATLPGSPVTAVVGGTVSFAGRVAGTVYVVVQQPDGLTATYGFLQRLAVVQGQAVVAGQLVGRATSKVYFGWKRGDQPVDPTPLLGRWRAPPRLVPTDGSPARPTPPGARRRLVCPAALSR